MKITQEMVEHIALLSRLRLTEEEAARTAGELERILDYMDVLDGLDAGGAEPMRQGCPLKNVLRADEVEPSTGRAELLRNAPDSDGEAFLAPKTVE